MADWSIVLFLSYRVATEPAMRIPYILSPFLDKIRALYVVSVQDSKSSPSQQEYIGNFRYFSSVICEFAFNL